MGACPGLGAAIADVATASMPSWFGEFAAGFGDVGTDAHEVALVGGNLSRGPLSVTVQLTGQVPAGHRACGAAAHSPGDEIWVSGTLGDAALGRQLAAGRCGGDANAGLAA